MQLGFDQHRGTRAGLLSGGTRQKLNLIAHDIERFDRLRRLRDGQLHEPAGTEPATADPAFTAEVASA